MEKATDEHNRKNGYVKDPRVPEQPGISDSLPCLKWLEVYKVHFRNNRSSEPFCASVAQCAGASASSRICLSTYSLRRSATG